MREAETAQQTSTVEKEGPSSTTPSSRALMNVTLGAPSLLLLLLVAESGSATGAEKEEERSRSVTHRHFEARLLHLMARLPQQQQGH
jgi:hypothetical protein